MSVPNNTDNEWLIHRELSDDLHLRKQRHALLALLEADEQVVAVASAGHGVGKPGILAVTTSA